MLLQIYLFNVIMHVYYYQLNTYNCTYKYLLPVIIICLFTMNKSFKK